MSTTIAEKASPHHRPSIAAGGIMLLGSAFLPATAFALDTQAAWQGIATVTASTTAQCAGIGATTVGDAMVSVFRPKIASTDTKTYLSFVFLRAAFTVENTSESTIHQMHGAGNDDILGVDGRANFIDGAGTYSLAISPAAVVATTPVITITGKINNYFNVTGCDVTFTGVYAKRVN